MTVARGLFDTATHQALQTYIAERAPMLPLGEDLELFGRRYAHNPPYLVAVHQQLAGYASEAFGEALKPSYVFLSLYSAGGRCPLHLDRPQCYRTIDYLIDQDHPEPWPIHIGAPMSDDQRQQIDDNGAGHPADGAEIAARIEAEQWTEILLEPNDAVLYSGTHQWHYRPTASTGSASLVFFHFVPVDYDGPLD